MSIVPTLKKRKKAPKRLEPKPLTERQLQALKEWGLELRGTLKRVKRK